MRAEAFKSEFLSRLHKLQDNPYAYGNLTVRSLLDLREHCLAEFDFHDPYLKQKRKENEQAVELFPARLQHLSQLTWEKRMVQVHVYFSSTSDALQIQLIDVISVGHWIPRRKCV